MNNEKRFDSQSNSKSHVNRSTNVTNYRTRVRTRLDRMSRRLSVIDHYMVNGTRLGGGSEEEAEDATCGGGVASTGTFSANRIRSVSRCASSKAVLPTRWSKCCNNTRANFCRSFASSSAALADVDDDDDDLPNKYVDEGLLWFLSSFVVASRMSWTNGSIVASSKSRCNNCNRSALCVSTSASCWATRRRSRLALRDWAAMSMSIKAAVAFHRAWLYPARRSGFRKICCATPRGAWGSSKGDGEDDDDDDDAVVEEDGVRSVCDT